MCIRDRVLTRALADQQARNAKTEFVLESGLQNQLWVYRPGPDGTPELVDNQEWFQNSKLRRFPPSKGLAPKWAEYRVRSSCFATLAMPE